MRYFIRNNDKIGESGCYGNLDIAYQSLGDYGKAIEYYEKSLEIAKDLGDRAGESTCYTNLGIAYGSLGDYEKAIEYNEKSLAINKDIGDIDSERQVNFNLGRIYDESEKLELAYEYYNNSIELSEMMGGRLVEEEHKIGFYARVSDAYQGMIPLCLKLEEKEGEAFEYTERSKSRAFLDLIANTVIKSSVALTGELKSLRDDEENYLSTLREIRMRHLRQTGVSVEPGEVEGIFRKLDEIYDEIEEHDPEYVFTRRGKPLSFDRVQNLLSSQRKDGNTFLIEYFITRDKTFIFVVSSKDNKLHIVPVSLSAEKLNRYVEVYWREVVDYHEFQDIGDSACQTGLNQRSPGDELIGLTRAFIYAGAPSVIVSLWSVDAHSTQELMHEFYTLLKNGTDKATALQEAQKRIMEKEGYSHPYYWAPFVLVGDWE